MHTHVYDEAGRLVRTVVVREPEWDEEQRAWMLGLAEREARECKRCGHDLAETLNPQWEWVPATSDPMVCGACAASIAQEQKHAKDPRAGAMLHMVKKRSAAWRKAAIARQAAQRQSSTVDSGAAGG